MSGFPQELVFVIVFGAIMLAQFLYRQLRGKVASMQVELELQEQQQQRAQAQAEAAAVLLRAQPGPVQTEAVDSPPAVLASPATPAAAARYASQLPPSRHQRRFSRQGLLADRRAVQDAIVIAAIMQPCHAQRPYTVD